MKILVTGAPGFVGIHVVQYLIRNGHKVIATSRDIVKAQKQNWYLQVEYIQFDYSDLPKHLDVYQFLGSPDVLIHLAWDGLSDFQNLSHINDNLFLNYNFLRNYVNNGGNHILVTGTCLEYGLYNGELREDLISDPVCAYGIAKDSLRRMLQELNKKYSNLSFQWLRLFYMYGNGQNSGSILPQLDAAVKNKETHFNMSQGDQLRDYLHIEKVAEFISKTALQKGICGIINCCSGKPVSVRKLVEDYVEEKKYSIKLNLGYYKYPNYEALAFWGNNDKIQKILNNNIKNAK